MILFVRLETFIILRKLQLHCLIVLNSTQSRSNLFSVITFSYYITTVFLLSSFLTLSFHLSLFPPALPCLLPVQSPVHSACVFATIALTSQSHSFILYFWQDWTHFCPTFFSSLCPPCQCTDGIFLCGTVEQELRAESLDTCQICPLCEVTISTRVANRLHHRQSLSLCLGLCACVCMHVCTVRLRLAGPVKRQRWRRETCVPRYCVVLLLM